MLFSHFLWVSQNAYSADDDFKSLAAEKAGVPWRISADEVTYDSKSEVVVARGNVLIEKPNKKISAEEIRFDHMAERLTAIGNVSLSVGMDTVSANRIELDLQAENGIIYDGQIFYSKNHFYITGDKLQKIDDTTYIAENASITSCDAEKPAWKIKAGKVKVNPEGYGKINHGTFWVKNIPIAYTPILFFPVNQERQSGFLIPQVNWGDRKGNEYIQPFFWAINESSDATFYGHYMGKRGYKYGLEYRYMLSERSKGTLMMDTFNDRKKEKNGKESKDYGFTDDEFLRSNEDRYWFRMKHDQELPYDFFAKLDIDIVSDQDYLAEFKEGYSGFKYTQREFLDTFERSLDDYNDEVRTNRMNLNRTWPTYDLNLETRWNDNVIKRRQGGPDDTLQQLPLVGFTGTRQPVSATPFYWDLTSLYNNFYRENGTRGQRIDLNPRIYYPWHFKSYFDLEPSIGFRETAYYIDKYDDPSAGTDDDTQHRELFDINVDLSTDIFKTYATRIGQADRVRHIIRPQITYEYIWGSDQDDLPFFNEIDRIDQKNLITYSITNNLMYRRSTSKPAQDDHANSTDPDIPEWSYNQFGRLKLQQSYDIDKARRDEPRVFSPIGAELDIFVGKWGSLQADTAWSTYDKDFISRNAALGLNDWRGDKLFVEYRYTRGDNESIYTDLLLKITERLWAYTEYERDIKEENRLLSGVGILIRQQCWSVDIGYQKDDQNKATYSFRLDLYGLGGLGEKYAGRSIVNPFYSQ